MTAKFELASAWPAYQQNVEPKSFPPSEETQQMSLSPLDLTSRDVAASLADLHARALRNSGMNWRRVKREWRKSYRATLQQVGLRRITSITIER